jgi:hypothetical protein
LFRHDANLLQPATAQLERALRQAAAAANGRAAAGLLPWPPTDLAAALALVAAAPEGRQEWLGRQAPAYETRSAVGVAWRRDYAGRLHVRVIGRRDLLPPAAGPLALDLFGLPPDWPALLRVHAAPTLLRERDGRTDAVVLCPCGAAGTPAEIGWMGDCCGPCFDRRAADGASPSPAAWPLPLPQQGNLGLPVASPDGAVVAALDDARRLRAWDTRTGRETPTALPPGAGLPAALSAGGRRVLLVRPSEHAATVWDVAAGAPVATLPLVVLHLAAFLPDGRVVFAVQGVPRLWSAVSGAAPLAFQGEAGGLTDGLAISPDGRALATANSRHGLRLWGVAERRVVSSVALPSGSPSGVAFSPDGMLLAVSFRPSVAWSPASLVLYDLARGAVRRVLQGPAAQQAVAAFTPDGRRLLALAGQCVGAWDAETGSELAHFRAVPGPRWLALLGDGRLASMTADGVVRVWPAEALAPG